MMVLLVLAFLALAGTTTEGRNSSWVVSENPCTPTTVSTTTNPCECTKGTTILLTCECKDNFEMLIVDQHDVESKSLVIWRIHNCSRVHIKKNAFKTLGENSQIFLQNIPLLHLEEESFKLKGVGQENGHISFVNTSMDRIPPRAFPSKVSRIEFRGGKIGRIETKAFDLFAFNQMLFEDVKVGSLEASAFASSMHIGNWTARRSEFNQVKSHAIASSITTMSWFSSRLDHVETNAMSAENEVNVIVNVEFSGCLVGTVEPFGLYFTQWSSLSLLNSSFAQVHTGGVNLSQPANEHVATLWGNSWAKVGRNFIVSGEEGSVKVRMNSFAKTCDCSLPLESLLDSNGSKRWFREEFLNNSLCAISERAAECLGQNETFLPLTSLDLFCSEEMFMCRAGVEDFPEFPTALRNLALIIGGVVGAIVILLTVTLCCCLCGEEREEKSASYTTASPSRSDSQSALLSARPRSAFFAEAIEMEDKQVQTLPSELSADVLETLRAKLKSPMEFWDAKETIDHLYDLIQVKEKHAEVRPPDVTMTCGDVPPPLPKTLPPPSSARYAQIRGKGKTTPLCEYQDPSDSRTHVYSELNSLVTPNNDLHVICEYTDPKDLQNHVYAELSSVKGNKSTCPGKMVKCPTIPSMAESHRPLPTIPSSSSWH